MIIGILDVKNNILYKGSGIEINTKLGGNKTTTIKIGTYEARTRDIILFVCDECNKEVNYPKRTFRFNQKKHLCRKCQCIKTSHKKYGTDSWNQYNDIKTKQHLTQKKYHTKEEILQARRKRYKKCSKEELHVVRSKTTKILWQDKNYRDKITKSLKVALNTPEHKKQRSENLKKLWQSFSFRKQQIQRIKKQWNDNDYKKMMSQTGIRISKFQNKVFNYYLNLNEHWTIEYGIPDTTLTVDLCNPLTHEVIECFGDYWHCNPRIYTEDYFHDRIKKTAKEIWLHDTNRINELKKLGYNVQIIWESEWNIE